MYSQIELKRRDVKPMFIALAEVRWTNFAGWNSKMETPLNVLSDRSYLSITSNHFNTRDDMLQIY